MGRICDNRNVHCAIHEDSMGCKRNVWKEDLVSGTVLVFMGRLSSIFNAYLHSLFFFLHTLKLQLHLLTSICFMLQLHRTLMILTTVCTVAGAILAFVYVGKWSEVLLL